MRTRCVMQFRTIGCAIGFLVLVLPVLAGAVTITYVGRHLDLGASWRTAAVAKPLDGDGDNVFGTDAFAVWTGPESWNNYVAFVSKAAAATYPSYYDIDNPVGAGVINSGTLSVNAGYGNEATLFTFQVNVVGPAPATFRVGIMTDNLDNSGYVPSSLTLAYGSSNVTAAIDATQGDNQDPDWTFFDISGAANGDTFTVKGAGGPYGYVTCGAVSFDAVPTPTPTTITYVGSDLDRGASWRTTTAVKFLDPDKDNVYGTDAYAVWSKVENWTNYVSLVSEAGNYPGNINYYRIDNPAGAGTIGTGTLNPSPGLGLPATLCRFLVNGTVPPKFRLGVMIDNGDGAMSPATLTLTMDGPSIHTTISPDAVQGANRIPDWYFFDVRSAPSGAQFTLKGTGGSSSYVTCAAVSFDTVPPRGTVISLK